MVPFLKYIMYAKKMDSHFNSVCWHAAPISKEVHFCLIEKTLNLSIASYFHNTIINVIIKLLITIIIVLVLTIFIIIIMNYYYYTLFYYYYYYHHYTLLLSGL